MYVEIKRQVTEGRKKGRCNDIAGAVNGVTYMVPERLTGALVVIRAEANENRDGLRREMKSKYHHVHTQGTYVISSQRDCLAIPKHMAKQMTRSMISSRR